jgi:hypothetical protein
MTPFNRIALAGAAIAAMIASYSLGAASAQGSTAAAKLDQSHDLLTKASAVIGSIVTRKGVTEVNMAKASVDKAIADVAAAKAAVGG